VGVGGPPSLTIQCTTFGFCGKLYTRNFPAIYCPWKYRVDELDPRRALGWRWCGGQKSCTQWVHSGGAVVPFSVQLSARWSKKLYTAKAHADRVRWPAVPFSVQLSARWSKQLYTAKAHADRGGWSRFKRGGRRSRLVYNFLRGGQKKLYTAKAHADRGE